MAGGIQNSSNGLNVLLQGGQRPPQLVGSIQDSVGFINEVWKQLVLVQNGCPVALRSTQDDFGALGREQMLGLIRAWFLQPRMAEDVQIKWDTCAQGSMWTAPLSQQPIWR